jgi:hypothetical protein
MLGTRFSDILNRERGREREGERDMQERKTCKIVKSTLEGQITIYKINCNLTFFYAFAEG